MRIADVAQRLARSNEHAVDVTYTGLRDGEKLHDELFGDGEPDVRPVHELISHVDVPPLAPHDVTAARIDLTEDTSWLGDATQEVGDAR